MDSSIWPQFYGKISKSENDIFVDLICLCVRVCSMHLSSFSSLLVLPMCTAATATILPVLLLRGSFPCERAHSRTNNNSVHINPLKMYSFEPVKIGLKDCFPSVKFLHGHNEYYVILWCHNFTW